MADNRRRMRILGQCGQVDFNDIEHLTASLENPAMLDMSTLSNRQVFAFNFYAHLYRRDIPYSLARAIVREVLFWGETDVIQAIEIKFKPNAERNDILKFRRLWS